MKIVKVVQTYKDGVLTSSKEVDMSEKDPQQSPWARRVQKTPKHHRILDLVDAAQVSSDSYQKTFNTLTSEVRSLRKKLIATERAVTARLKERDAIKKAYQSRCQQVSSLKEKNEDLEAKLFAVSGDLKFLEEAQRLPTTKFKQASPKNILPRRSAPITKSVPNTKPTPEPVRSIAAKPVKR